MENIVLDCERMKYEDTGLYHYCLNLNKAILKNLDSKEGKLSFYSPGNAVGTFGKDKEYIRQHSYHKFRMPGLKNYSIWHATYQNTDYLPVRNSNIKVVLTIHDLNFIYDEKKSQSKKKKYLRHLQNNIDRSDAIVCVSEYCKNDVLYYCDPGNRPIHIIHNGTNSLNTPTLSGTSYVPQKRFIFSIGVITRKKNFHSLLPLLQNNDMELLIAGRKDDTDYLNYILACARKLGVEKNLRVLGNISESEKAWYFENCYAFASPSMAEGFCMPVTEAMSLGKPLFLSKETALPEIGGKVAFYFSDFNGDNMQNVFLNGMHKYTSTDMHLAIKERSTAFCWEKAAKKYIDVYRSL